MATSGVKKSPYRLSQEMPSTWSGSLQVITTHWSVHWSVIKGPLGGSGRSWGVIGACVGAKEKVVVEETRLQGRQFGSCWDVFGREKAGGVALDLRCESMINMARTVRLVRFSMHYVICFSHQTQAHSPRPMLAPPLPHRAPRSYRPPSRPETQGIPSCTPSIAPPLSQLQHWRFWIPS